MSKNRRTSRRGAGGFTLVEILIVVVILGILAAIVIPQFGEASTDARTSSLTSQLQMINSQITLYRLNHNDNPPSFTANGWGQMINPTDISGTINPGSGTTYGPYLQTAPVNPLTNSSTIEDKSLAPDKTAGWFLDASTGLVHGVNVNGAISDDGN